MNPTWHTPIADLGSHSAADLHALGNTIAAQLTDGTPPQPSDLARIADALERIADTIAGWED